VNTAFRTGERIYFRPLELGDLEFLQGLVNCEEIQQFIGIYWPLNGAAERAWLEGLYKNRETFPFGIALKEGQRLIGSCELRLGPAAHRTADLGIGIAEPEFQGRGYGAEAIRLLIGYGFETLNLHRIELKVFANNPRGIACYEKCGFKREGVLREARWWNGRWWDVFEYGILEREWQSASAAPGAELRRDETLSSRNAAK
jgi:RimJ/RimL family protein N-acetyltransferase